MWRRAPNMASSNAPARTFNWRVELPTFCGSLVILREPAIADAAAVLELLSLPFVADVETKHGKQSFI